jgi:hypothetical protein
VIRVHCLPEDEGMGQLLGNFVSKEKAYKFMEEFTEKGYFTKGDLEIVYIEDI